jgi:hypothetical protein
MFVSLSHRQVKQMKQGVPFIVVPYRDNAEQQRSKQLASFVSHIKRYHPDWHVLIVEQSQDGKKFNRGALLNIGAYVAKHNHHSYVIFHDVDLLPLAKIAPYYTAVPTLPIHIGKAWTQKYDYPKFLGGVLSMSIADIEKINGFPNNFWGWGGEDDALRNRLERKNIKVLQPEIRNEGFRELTHLDTKTKTEWKNMTKWEDLKEDTGRSGFRNVSFEIVDAHEYNSNIIKITVEIKQ